MVKKVMVVDDDSGVIYTVKHGIEGLDKNYEIISANSGKKCLELLQENKIPDIILLDIMMPDMSGWETYQKIKQNHPIQHLHHFLAEANRMILKCCL